MLIAYDFDLFYLYILSMWFCHYVKLENSNNIVVVSLTFIIHLFQKIFHLIFDLRYINKMGSA